MMKILVVAMTVVLSACTIHSSDDTKTSCLQQAEAACETNDAECKSTIIEDCTTPPPCTAPIGQHC